MAPTSSPKVATNDNAPYGRNAIALYPICLGEQVIAIVITRRLARGH
ncbi:hypothetical protein [Mastigocladopsis repens]|nr:hypothetical protein [Mastigocladopsis repens]